MREKLPFERKVTKRLVVCLLGLAIIVILSERYEDWLWAYAVLDPNNLRPVEGLWAVVALVGMTFLSISAIVFFLISGNAKVLTSAIEAMGRQTRVDLSGRSERIEVDEEQRYREELERGD